MPDRIITCKDAMRGAALVYWLGIYIFKTHDLDFLDKNSYVRDTVDGMEKIRSESGLSLEKYAEDVFRLFALIYARLITNISVDAMNPKESSNEDGGTTSMATETK